MADAVRITDEVFDWEQARVLYFVFAVLTVMTCVSLCLSIFVWKTAKDKTGREAKYAISELA